MSDKDSKKDKKSVREPTYGSRSAPAYDPSSGVEIGKPRPPPKDD